MTNAISLAVLNPEIPEVAETDTWKTHAVQDLIGSDYAAVIQLRLAVRSSIARNEPIYACPRCGVPVYLVCREDSRRFYFKHLAEDGNCPAVTRGNLSEREINARKYNAAKESHDHLRMKEIIAESIACDPRFSESHVEKTWRGADGTWRRPDVQAIFGKQKIAFEIQLSTTFIRVIAERREFYLAEGGMLIWLFKSFAESGNRLTQDDVFYNNNRNAFLATEETLAESKASGKLHLECRWSAPSRVKDSIVFTWNRKIVSIDELIFDPAGQRIFYFDFDAAITEASVTPKQARAETLRHLFEEFWLDDRFRTQESVQDWRQFRHAFDEQGLRLPQYPSEDGLSTLLNNLYSAKHGKVVGRSYKRFIEVAHVVAGGHKRHLWAFRLLLSAHDRGQQLIEEDLKGLWRKKVLAYKPLMASGAEQYRPDGKFHALIRFLFPEIEDKLDSYPSARDTESSRPVER